MTGTFSARRRRDPDWVGLEVLRPQSLVCVSVADGASESIVKDGIKAAFSEVQSAWHFDWLIDLLGLPNPLSLDDMAELSDAWQKIAQGRDVGRRTAFVTRDHVLHASTRTAVASSTYRTIGVFDTAEDALSWLRTIAVSGPDEGIQPI